jgi:carbonic anhydrase
VDNWLRHVGDVLQKHRALVEALEQPSLRHARLCELNVIEQVLNLCQTTVVQDAWDRGQAVAVHAWIYSLYDGRAHELGHGVAGRGELADTYAQALQQLTRPLET